MKALLLIPALFVVGAIWLLTWPFAAVHDLAESCLGDR